MDNFKLCVPCLFGLEGLVGNELRRMGMENVSPENGRVFFSGSAADIARVNIFSKFGERLLVVVGTFRAETFEELFQGVRALPWETFIAADAKFPVKGFSISSTLHSVPDCQSIVKKAVVERLKEKYGVTWFEETAELYQIQFAIIKDDVTVYIDTSGEGLHKRGYRAVGSVAPIRETLAAAMVDLAQFRGKGEFLDPFCGSGTIAIEAAMAAKNRAPGLYRHFQAETWRWLDSSIWENARTEAKAKEFYGQYLIYASDIDEKCVRITAENAEKAGVGAAIRVNQADAREFKRSTDRGVIVTNPPYGERLMEKKQAEVLYAEFGKALAETQGWQVFLLSSHTEFEKSFGRQADKKRKLYNGMIKCDLFMYLK